MDYEKLLIPPHIPGQGIEEDRWLKAFGNLGPFDRQHPELRANKSLNDGKIKEGESPCHT